MNNPKKRVTITYLVCTLLAVAASFLLHEFCHWITGQALGYDMVMTLNKVYPNSLSYRRGSDYNLVSFTGPLITLVQGIAIYFLMRRTSNPNVYPFLFAPFYLELLSGIMNISRPNDLGRISQSFGLGLFTLPLVFILIQFYLVFTTSKRGGYTMKFNGLTLFLILIFSSLWILTNQQWNVVIIP